MERYGEVARVLLTEEEIRSKVSELGAQITEVYKGSGRPLHVIVILKGATIFASDLVRAIDLPVSLDFMAISSYGNQTKSSGVVRIVMDLDRSIEGRDVLVVEDIVDSGLTLKYLLENLRGRNPATLRTCVLLDKFERREVDVTPDFVGFQIPDEFVVGYGLDFAEKYRNLPYLGVLKPGI